MLFESLAITLYLAKKHSTGPALSGHARRRGRAWQWSLWAVTEVDRGVNIWSLHAVRLPPEERDAGQARRGAQGSGRRRSRCSTRRSRKQPYLLGNDFTVADLNVAAVISRADRDGFDRGAEPESLADALPGAAGGAREALALKTAADDATPVDVTRRIARINRL